MKYIYNGGFFTGVSFLYIINKINYKVVSLPNENQNKNKLKGRVFMMNSFLFKDIKQMIFCTTRSYSIH